MKKKQLMMIGLCASLLSACAATKPACAVGNDLGCHFERMGSLIFVLNE